MSLLSAIDTSRLPRHIAIVMDGNGRWARQRRMPRIFGHRAGVAAVRRVVEACSKLGIEVVTLYAFSTENWVRPAGEVQGLMRILTSFLRSEEQVMMRNNIRLRTIGDRSRLSAAVRHQLEATLAATGANTGLILNLALNYGGRQEIVQAVNRLIQAGAAVIDEKNLAGQLDTAGLPDPDLFIRTSGEMRLSNFLLWQLAYTELYITQELWPDFGPEELYAAIIEYQKRERRYGGIVKTGGKTKPPKE